MTLRYVVELKTTQTFTAQKKVEDESEINYIVNYFKNQNLKEGYSKYCGLVLYDDNNKIIKKISL